jgi:hypothetical protein
LTEHSQGSDRGAGHGPTTAIIADELNPIVENDLDQLDRWLSVSGPSALP